MTSKISFGSNLSSMKAQRSLFTNSRDLNHSMEKLSSGMRITRAMDDAASISVASKLGADSTVLKQSVRNANDGISMLNIADRALSQLNDILVRQKELAEQAANGVYSRDQRIALHEEANSLVEEYNRIVDGAEYNGQKLLDGSTSDVSIQLGYGDDGKVDLNLGNQLKRTVGDGTFETPFSIGIQDGTAVAAGDLTGDGVDELVLRDCTSNFEDYVYSPDGSPSWSDSVSEADNNALETLLEDFNGDGKLDMVGSSVDTGEVSLRFGNGDGTFTGDSNLISGSSMSSSYVELLSAGDFDGDGSTDLAIRAESGGANDRMGVFLNDGEGNFEEAWSRSVTGEGTVVALCSADIDGDASLDLITALASDTVQIARGNGDGTFNASSELVFSGNISGMDVGDLDNDGYVDVVAVVDPGSLEVAFGDPGGSFTMSTLDSSSLNGVWELQLADFNSDGLKDVLFTIRPIPMFTGKMREVVLRSCTMHWISHRLLPPLPLQWVITTVMVRTILALEWRL